MTTEQSILHTLADSGPASIRELCDTLAHTEPSSEHEHVCLELYGLIRADKVAVSMGMYSAI